jgi:hypothetical protein
VRGAGGILAGAARHASYGPVYSKM